MPAGKPPELELELEPELEAELELEPDDVVLEASVEELVSLDELPPAALVLPAVSWRPPVFSPEGAPQATNKEQGATTARMNRANSRPSMGKFCFLVPDREAGD